MANIIDIFGKRIDVAQAKLAISTAECEESLVEFIQQAWHIVEPGADYIHNWHVDMIAEHLEAITYGDEIDGHKYNRLLINVPPGMMKSLLTNVFWPAWEWGPKNMPHLRYLCASHSMDLAIRDSTKMRRLIESEWYQERWGDRVKLTKDQNQKTKFENTQTGFRQAVAAGSITGARGDRVIIDDPHSVEGAASEQQRSSTIEWFLEAVPTRLNKPRESAIVVIMQRLHEEDVSGVIIDKELGYDHVMLPMRYDAGRAQPTMLGISDPRTEDGELIFPDRFPESVVDRDERTMGPYACNTGEAPVLMSDLSLKRIDEVRAGDEVLGWVKDDGGRSRIVRTKIKQTFKYHAPVVKMTLDSGEVIRCTPDHKWWRARWEEGRNEYAPAKIGTSLARVCPSHLPNLSPEESRLAGWLSGFFDGEGTVSVCNKNGSKDYRPSQQIHFYQGAGRNLPLCEKLEMALNHFGFKFTYQEDERKPNKNAPCYGYRAYNLVSGQQSLGLAQRFLHIVQPTKWRNRIEDMALGAKFVKGWEKVVSIEPDGEDDVYALETETGNYVVWGLCSSNSAGQFQQSPEPRGGGVIKREWIQYWEHAAYPPFDYIIAAVDTAYTEKTENDPSAMTVWGVWSGGDQTAQITRAFSADGQAAILNRQYKEDHPKVMLMYAWQERLPLHELVTKVQDTMQQFSVDKILIENKASGYSVAQEIRRLYGYEEFTVQLVDPKGNDKLSRLYSVQHLFAEGLIFAPAVERNGALFPKAWADMVINQLATFPRSKHDDLCFVEGTKIEMADGSMKAIESVIIGDVVSTPSGDAVISAAGMTSRMEETWRVNFDGGWIEGTANHPIMANGKWTPLHCLSEGDVLELSYPKRGAASWLLRAINWLRLKAFISTDINTIDTQNQTIRLTEDILRARGLVFIEMFGNIITVLFQKIFKFITLMATQLTMTFQTLSVCHSLSTEKNISMNMSKEADQKNGLNIFARSENWHQLGIRAKKVELGIESMLKIPLKSRVQPSHSAKAFIQGNANGAALYLVRVLLEKSYAVIRALVLNQDTCLVKSIVCTHTLKPVYNLTVEGAHCYYANGILVHNCDTASMALRHLRDIGLLVRSAEWTADIDRGRMHVGAAPRPLYPV